MLDVGVGTGVLSIAGARSGWRVTGVDLNPRALRLARINAHMNHARIRLVESDLCSGLRAGQRFEWVVANLPFETAPPRVPTFMHSDGGRYGDNQISRFLAEVGTFVEPDGKVVVLAFSLLHSEGPSRLETEAQAQGVLSWCDSGVVRLSDEMEIDLLYRDYPKKIWRDHMKVLRDAGHESFRVELGVFSARTDGGRYVGAISVPHAGPYWMYPVGGSARLASPGLG
jgi:SAM-dependent methyltransferase